MSETTPVLALDSDLTIHHAAELKDRLLAALAAGTRCLDLRDVGECDSAGVQLLLAARRSAQQQGHTLSLAPVSEPVREVLQRYGLLHVLGAAA
ncbi:anti-anti-sigma regulatory factor (antagonist of anti-sigma factor) [Burkholderiales bacterium JOSHI_001]|nr:anti-anti-sigma regulatory factor (antagonist of anti-sigma factor) [Burkholderiales bacterium JOSHI_001]